MSDPTWDALRAPERRVYLVTEKGHAAHLRRFRRRSGAVAWCGLTGSQVGWGEVQDKHLLPCGRCLSVAAKM